MSRGAHVHPGATTRIAIMTVEGERDDISGLSQTGVTYALTPNMDQSKHENRD